MVGLHVCPRIHGTPDDVQKKKQPIRPSPSLPATGSHRVAPRLAWLRHDTPRRLGHSLSQPPARLASDLPTARATSPSTCTAAPPPCIELAPFPRAAAATADSPRETEREIRHGALGLAAQLAPKVRAQGLRSLPSFALAPSAPIRLVENPARLLPPQLWLFRLGFLFRLVWIELCCGLIAN